MKRIILITFISLLIFLAIPNQTYAHTLKIDGNIGVNTHIEPDDTPIANQESKILVDITDKSGRFNPSNPSGCDCVLFIKQNGQELQKMNVVTNGMFAPLRYTFPSAGSYQVTVEGKSNGNGPPFQSFSVTYDYYVKGASGSLPTILARNPLQDQFSYITVFAGTLIILLFLYPVKTIQRAQSIVTSKAKNIPAKSFLTIKPIALLIITILLAGLGIWIFQSNVPKSIQTKNEPVDREIRVVATNFSFVPNLIEVKQGERIRLKLFSKQGTHGISVPEVGLTAYMPEGEEVTEDFTASKAGEYVFICSIYCGSGHGEMIGKLIIKEE